ncbi:MAG: DUF2254 domain-containing protein [Chitinophagales bacterium]|nr:DUF2254 domain-containing protein [Hyphomicrobiales bacterium]
MFSNLYRRLYLRAAIKSFWFIPAALGLAGFGLAVVMVFLDRTFIFRDDFIFYGVSAITARSVLETIASAAVTIISLTYSMTLVVFTLAAGNIAPRLLRNFREDKVSQAGIGIFCGTFLYALSVLYIISADEVPRLSTLIALLLAALCVYTLIYYVHNVSQQVLVDTEIARSVRKADAVLCSILENEDDRGHSALPQSAAKSRPEILHAKESGYVALIEVGAIVKLAAKHDLYVEMLVKPGDFVVEHMTIANFWSVGKVFDAPRVSEELLKCGVVLEDSRTPGKDIGFSMHLVIEIAMRALSPGINDSYTAASCVDNLSTILCKIVSNEEPSNLHYDEGRLPRLKYATYLVANIFEAVFTPIRINARGNILVTLRMLVALRRGAEQTLPKYADVIRLHTSLLLQDARACITNGHDLATIEEAGAIVENALKRRGFGLAA